MLVSRDPYSAQMLKAFGLKGFPTDMSPTVIPSVSLMDMEKSAWPPFSPFTVCPTVAALAANFSGTLLSFAAGAPAQSRIVIDEVIMMTSDPASVRIAIGVLSDIAGQTPFANATLMDGSNDPLSASSQTVISVASTFTFQNVGHQVGLIGRYPNQANVLNVIRPFYPLAILRPGQIFALENESVNGGLTTRITGRFYVGQ